MSPTKGVDVYGPYHRFTASLPCWVRRSSPLAHTCRRIDYSRPLVEGHHDRTVGAGGVDYDNEIPLCQQMHYAIHQLGKPLFEERFQVSVEAGIVWVRGMWDARDNRVVWYTEDLSF